MNHVLIEPHYLGSLEYFVVLASAGKVTFEVHQHFTKQTYKNRCYLLTTQGTQALSVPVHYGNRTPYKDVKIDHRQSWKREHWGAFYSAYGKAPFFEFFVDHFQETWAREHQFLYDLNREMMTLCLKILQIDIPIQETKTYDQTPNSVVHDLREHILPKKPFQERNFYIPFPYLQNFGNIFVENLSIVDLLMCEGNHAAEILKKSSS